MSKFKESFKFGDSLILDGKTISPNKLSGKIIGEVTCNEYDKLGNLLFSDTSTNDVTLPGSIFVLEQIFKKASNTYRFLHPLNNFPTGTYINQSTGSMNNTNSNIVSSDEFDSYIEDEYVFGFMVGNGGESSTSIIAPKYESDSLIDNSNGVSFLPIRITGASEIDPNDDGIDYYLRLTSGDYNYYYAKSFTNKPIISTKWADGSGSVSGEDAFKYDTPILTHAEVVLNIDESDIREYFGSAASQECFINQLGLIAGKPQWEQDDCGRYKKDYEYISVGNNPEDKEGLYVLINDEYILYNETEHSQYIGNYYRKEVKYILINEGELGVTRYRLDFKDVKLITTLNFKAKDLSNNENKLKFIYRIYCL